MSTMLSVEDAQAQILERIVALSCENVPILEALDRVLSHRCRGRYQSAALRQLIDGWLCAARGR